MNVAGKDFATLDEDGLALFRRQHVGIVFQSFHLIPTMTALENVAMPLELAGAPDAFATAQDALSAIGLDTRTGHYPAQLSGGEQQRVALARAFVDEPNLILADEPTGNVDDEIAMRLLYLFEELHKMGTTVLVATHNQALVDRFNHPSLHLSAGLLGAVAPKGGTQSLTAARSSRPAARSRPTRKPGSA